MATYDELKNQLILETGGAIDDIVAGTLLNRSYYDLQENHHWSFLRKAAILTLIAPYTTGTLATDGTTAFVGTSTVWTSAMVGRHIRVGSDEQFYKISTFTDTTNITIEAAYAYGTLTAQTYEIFQHIYALETDFKEMISPVFQSRLYEASLQDIDRYDPERDTNDDPVCFAYRGVNSSGTQEIEVYPIPLTAQAYRYKYWAKPFALSAASDTAYIPDSLLINDTLYRIYLLKAGQATQEKDHAQAKAFLTLAQQYFPLAQNALTEAQRRDRTLWGLSRHVRDAAQDGVVIGSDYETTHQVSRPGGWW